MTDKQKEKDRSDADQTREPDQPREGQPKVRPESLPGRNPGVEDRLQDDDENPGSRDKDGKQKQNEADRDENKNQHKDRNEGSRKEENVTARRDKAVFEQQKDAKRQADKTLRGGNDDDSDDQSEEGIKNQWGDRANEPGTQGYSRKNRN